MTITECPKCGTGYFHGEIVCGRCGTPTVPSEDSRDYETEGQCASISGQLAEARKLIEVAIHEASDKSEPPLHYVLLVLGIAIRVQLERLEASLGAEWKHDLIAWACRNLLELDLWTQYILSGPDNATKLFDERLIDETTFFEAWIAYLEVDTDFSDWPEPDKQTFQSWLCSSLEDARAESQARNLSDRWLSMRGIAKQLGRTVEFDGANRMYSKLVHQTAFSLLYQYDVRLRLILGAHGRRHAYSIATHLRKYLDLLLKPQ